MQEGFAGAAGRPVLGFSLRLLPALALPAPLLLAPLLFTALPAFSQRTQLLRNSAPSDQYSYARHYVLGEVDEYEIRARTEGSDAELIAITSHETILIDGVPHERVSWLRATGSQRGDLTSLLKLVPPYDISLHPEGKLELFTPPADPLIVQLATDLYTFWHTLSARSGIAHLRRVGDEHDNPEPLTGNFADEDEFLVGEDISAQRLRFVSLDATVATYEADALPPPEPAIKLHRAWMQPSVCNGKPNNFQMVQRQEHGFLVSWGCEQFHIASEVDRKSGRILSASMDDELHWRVKLCSDEQLTDCIERPDFARRRHVSLTLRPRHDLPASDRLKINWTDSLPYVLIPAGSFQMGCVLGYSDCYAAERPRHRVSIGKPFWLAQTEVTVKAYEQFCEETGRSMPVEPGSGRMPGFNAGWHLKDHPIVKVSWRQASDFCTWSGGRLPTEAEWEYAERGGADGLKYPWGNDRSHDEANFWKTGGRDQWRHTAPVSSFPANGFGLHDMAGNVYEWVADWYGEDYCRRSPAANPRGPLRGTQRVARGGPGFINPRVLRTSSRLRVEPDAQRIYLCFRCAQDVSP